ncbi:MAG: site-specific DNA-methyltransferase [Candidatus Delongbacteria bacterium]|nr:site-specific DNA-methyltransferase [Candidatus Delongbacteria bacterium]
MIHNTEIFPSERQKLFDKLSNKLETAFNLSRKIVSFQANKEKPIYRWFKYKEGFSSALVKYFLTEYSTKPGKVLDPFAGTGTSLFAGQELGWKSTGIELLPVGVFVMQSREAFKKINPENLKETIKNLWIELSSVEKYDKVINHISITKDAFPADTEISLNKFLTFCSNIKDSNLQTILRFAAFSVLEEISYTRKDGQYLRWDYRSKRELNGKPFNKGRILSFEEALRKKLTQILNDLPPITFTSLFEQVEYKPIEQFPVKIIKGSCLEELPKINNELFDFIITSPPYCNRYDYTRTYALELIFLNYNNYQVRDLRQSMLSCTVENKEKNDNLKLYYESIGKLDCFEKVLSVYNSSKAMTEVNSVLLTLNKNNNLNNNNIPRMVKNYFLEMCFVISEMARVTKSGGHCVMVNDNVRYGGEEIPVDLILSDFAESFGYIIKKIFVLPKGKGNSSQQMGNYGRTEVRKCVYLWQKK